MRGQANGDSNSQKDSCLRHQGVAEGGHLGGWAEGVYRVFCSRRLTFSTMVLRIRILKASQSSIGTFVHSTVSRISGFCAIKASA